MCYEKGELCRESHLYVCIALALGPKKRHFRHFLTNVPSLVYGIIQLYSATFQVTFFQGFHLSHLFMARLLHSKKASLYVVFLYSICIWTISFADSLQSRFIDTLRQLSASGLSTRCTRISLRHRPSATQNHDVKHNKDTQIPDPDQQL